MFLWFLAKNHFCLFFVYIFNLFKILWSHLHYDIIMTSYADGWCLFWYQWKEETRLYSGSKHKGIGRLLYKIQWGGCSNPPFRCTENGSGGRGLKMIKLTTNKIWSSFFHLCQVGKIAEDTFACIHTIRVPASKVSSCGPLDLEFLHFVIFNSQFEKWCGVGVPERTKHKVSRFWSLKLWHVTDTIMLLLLKLNCPGQQNSIYDTRMR